MVKVFLVGRRQFHDMSSVNDLHLYYAKLKEKKHRAHFIKNNRLRLRKSLSLAVINTFLLISRVFLTFSACEANGINLSKESQIPK